MPTSSEQCQSLCPSGNPRAVLSGLLLITLITLMGSIARNAASQETPFQPNWYMVIDRANMLDKGQETSAINAAWMLSTGGIPAQVVTELAASTPELANQRARELLVANKIESAANAGDGVLVYAAMDPNNRTEVYVGIATGPNLLPHGGLTESDMVAIRDEIVQVQLTDGHPARAIVYALREMIYHDMFTPPPVEPMIGWRNTVNSVLVLAGPVIALVSIAAVFVSVRSVARFGGAVLPLVGGMAMALLLATIAMMAQSGLGVLSAVAVLVAVVVLAMSVDRRIRSSGHRQLTVTPRPPGTFTSTARKHP